jgi:hypothetical protein
MNANEYLAMEQAVRDRIDEAERFRSEQAFRSETLAEEATDAAEPAPDLLTELGARLVTTARCLVSGRPSAA